MPNVSRRAVVQTAALVPFQAIRGTAQNSAVKIGLIGAGSRGAYTSRTVAKDPRTKIVAICDIFDEQIENAKAKIPAPDARAYKNYKDLLDHLCVIYDYPGNVQATFIGSQMTPRFYRSNHERYIGENGFIETAREYWTYSAGTPPVTEKSGQDITIDSLQAFVNRVTEGKPENTGVRGAESTLTCILGQMAIDLRREVTWEEMMKSG